MKSDEILKYSLTAAVLAIIVILMVAGLGVSDSKRDAMECTCVNIEIKDSTESNFVSRADVRNYVTAEIGNYKGKKLKDLDIKNLEKAIDSKSAVLKSEVFITGDGALNVEVTQRKPMIRFQKGSNGFYCDEFGFLFPLKSNYSSYVTVVDGEIPLDIKSGYKGKGKNEAERKWISDMISLVAHMQNDKVWAEDIVQINVRKNGDLVLVPREGKEKFILGKPEKFEEKFELMSYYYKSIVPAKGKDYYSTVNVKYDGQIICRK